MPSKIALSTAKILLDTQSIKIRPHDPFRLVSGRLSPVYVDCRQLISFPKERTILMQLMKERLESELDLNDIDFIAGGETAGIPYAAFLAHLLDKPMIYVRKENKGYGRAKRIEGVFGAHPLTKTLERGVLPRVLLVEDQSTDGSSKLSFVDAIRSEGGVCNHCIVLFYYDIFKSATTKLQDYNLALYHLANWWDVIAYIETNNIIPTKDQILIRQFLENPEDTS